jgi:hypothetical protein
VCSGAQQRDGQARAAQRTMRRSPASGEEALHIPRTRRYSRRLAPRTPMLAYRHAFHAGNHADVLKHLVLTLVLRT